MTPISRLVELLDTLLANVDKLPDHSKRDPVTGKLTYKRDPVSSSWGRETIRVAFPERGGGSGIGTRLRYLVSRYVLTVDDLIRTVTPLKALQPWINTAQSQFYSDFKAAMTRTFLDAKDADFIGCATALWVQTPLQKEEQRAAIPTHLEARLDEPIDFDLDHTIRVMRESADTDSFAVMAILLELALGSRSVDLINEEVMTLRLHDTDQTMVVRTGRSKVRSDEQWAIVKEATLDVKPIGLTPVECVAMLSRFREGIPAIVDELRKVHVVEMAGMTQLHALQFINSKLSVRFSERFHVAARRLFPEQAAFAESKGRKFTTHVFRALHCNMAYSLHGEGRSEDNFLKSRLQHVGYGSVVNYKTVRVVDAHKTVKSLKRKSPTGPRHRPAGPQTVELFDIHGKSHTMQKHRLRQGTTAEERLVVVRAIEAQLTSLEIPITSRAIMRMGIGSRCVNLLRAGRKKPLPSYECTSYGREKVL